jgi:hypothetical protein
MSLGIFAVDASAAPHHIAVHLTSHSFLALCRLHISLICFRVSLVVLYCYENTHNHLPQSKYNNKKH